MSGFSYTDRIKDVVVIVGLFVGFHRVKEQ